MRKSGSSGCPRHAGTHVVQLFGFQESPREGRPPAGLRHFGGAAVLGPGFEPGSERFRAVRRAELDQPSMSVVIACLVGRPGIEPGEQKRLFYKQPRLHSGLPPRISVVCVMRESAASEGRNNKRATGRFSQVALLGASSAFSSATGEPPGSDRCYRGRRLRLRRESRTTMGGSTPTPHRHSRRRSNPADASCASRKRWLASWAGYGGSRSSWSWLGTFGSLVRSCERRLFLPTPPTAAGCRSVPLTWSKRS
jgi:hypothetical protein